RTTRLFAERRGAAIAIEAADGRTVTVERECRREAHIAERRRVPKPRNVQSDATDRHRFVDRRCECVVWVVAGRTCNLAALGQRWICEDLFAELRDRAHRRLSRRRRITGATSARSTSATNERAQSQCDEHEGLTANEARQPRSDAHEDLGRGLNVN